MSEMARTETEADRVRNQLHEKDQLVAALTERLEQAAEQLDRLRRTGIDTGRRPPAGGLPAELVEEHRTTLDDLKRVIANWENLQADAALGRIEMQIAELRDLFVSSGAARGGAEPPAGLSAAARDRPAEAQKALAGPSKPSAAFGKPTGNAWWEAQKAALLGEPVPAEVRAALAAPPAEPEPERDAPDDQAGASGSGVNAAWGAVPDLPAPVDFEALTLDAARLAILERDRLIEQLREPLLLLKAGAQLPAGLPPGGEIPESLKQCIAELEGEWQAKFRQMELDLSLERARLAREESALRQQQEALQKQALQASPAGKAGRGNAVPGSDEDNRSRRRWFRFIGPFQGNGAN